MGIRLILKMLKYTFLHVPRTAGVSISKVLGIPRSQQNHKTISERSWDENCFKFCFVRNPWDRFLSCYLYLKSYGRRGPGDLHDGRIVNKFNGFDEFVMSFDKIKSKFADRHFHQQVFFIDKPLDFIGRFENLQKDFDLVCDKIETPRQRIPHMNRSKPRQEYYTAETQKIVAELYKKDIEKFGYKPPNIQAPPNKTD